jgi:hypothetical protein
VLFHLFRGVYDAKPGSVVSRDEKSTGHFLPEANKYREVEGRLKVWLLDGKGGYEESAWASRGHRKSAA